MELEGLLVHVILVVAMIAGIVGSFHIWVFPKSKKKTGGSGRRRLISNGSP